jgi:hypothetical protein
MDRICKGEQFPLAPAKSVLGDFSGTSGFCLEGAIPEHQGATMLAVSAMVAGSMAVFCTLAEAGGGLERGPRPDKSSVMIRTSRKH